MSKKETAIRAYQKVYQDEKERILIRCIKDLIHTIDEPIRI